MAAVYYAIIALYLNICNLAWSGTKKEKVGEIVMISKTKLIKKLANVIEPTTIRQAMQTPDAEKLKEACEAEHESLLRNKTYVSVTESEVPTDIKILRSRYVFKKATDSKGDLKKFKFDLLQEEIYRTQELMMRLMPELVSGNPSCYCLV